MSMSMSTAYFQNCKSTQLFDNWVHFSKNEISLIFFYLFILFFLDLDSEIDFLTTTMSTFVANDCENQTQSYLVNIEDRINVVVPYLVILGKWDE
jgi:hypothetical protein